MPEKATALSFEEFSLLMNSLDPFEGHPRIAVAVSGGSDSLALCLLLQNWVQARNGYLVALTIDHQLRAESKHEAQQVQTWLKAYNIPHVILPWNDPKPTSGVQEAARQARYRLLEEWCQQHAYLHLFLGHQQEDQCETIVLRLLHQSGLVGLAGMSKVVEKPFLRILRPLLTITKDRLRQLLIDQNQEWLEDPSNTDPCYQRNLLRKMIPLNVSEIMCPQPLIQDLRLSIEAWVNRFLSHHTCIYPLGYAKLRGCDFLRLPVEFQSQVLLQILKTIGVGYYPPRMKALGLILEQMKEPRFKAVTCHGIRISIHQNHFLFVREHLRVKEAWFMSSSLRSPIHFDQRFEVHTKALDECGGPDLCIKKVGEGGWQQLLSHYPLLKKIHLHKPILWSLPAAWRGEEILLKYNMIYEWLIMPQEKNRQKNFIFKPYYPFSCFLFVKSS